MDSVKKRRQFEQYKQKKQKILSQDLHPDEDAQSHPPVATGNALGEPEDAGL